MNILQEFLNELRQEYNSSDINKRFGCDKIDNYHRRRVCLMTGRLKYLKDMLSKCQTDRCRYVYTSKIKKWNQKLNDEMASKVNRRLDTKNKT